MGMNYLIFKFDNPVRPVGTVSAESLSDAVSKGNVEFGLGCMVLPDLKQAAMVEYRSKIWQADRRARFLQSEEVSSPDDFFE